MARRPQRSGGGELIDQGMHLLDLTHWLAGPLPLHSALLRTQFWDVPVEDNAALILGEARRPRGAVGDAARDLDRVEEPVLARGLLPAAKLQVDGLVRSYGPQTLRIYRMSPEMGPPASRSRTTAPRISHGRRSGSTSRPRGDPGPLLGDLDDAHYAWTADRGRLRVVSRNAEVSGEAPDGGELRRQPVMAD